MSRRSCRGLWLLVWVILLGSSRWCAAGEEQGDVVRTIRRGDADCSARFGAVDALAAVRGLGGGSVCGNDDCDRDGEVTAADVDCAARCLFGRCAIPANAPAATDLDPELTPQIAPLTGVRLRGNNLGGPDSVREVTIGGAVALVVESGEDDEILFVVPDLPPGTYPLVITQDGVAGPPAPITIVAPAPIAPPDTAESTAFLFDEVISEFLTLDLEGYYGDETAAGVRDALASLRLELLGEFLAFGNDEEVTPEQRAELDAAIDASGIPERLRDILAQIQEAGASGAIADGGTAAGAGTIVVGAIAKNIGSTVAVAGGILELLGTISAPHLAAIAHLLGIGVGVVISLPTLLTPVITQITYVDSRLQPRQFPTEAGYVQVRVKNLAPNEQVRLVGKTAHYDFLLEPDATGNTIQYKLPPAASICGKITLAVENRNVGYRSSRTFTYVQPEMTALEPTTAKPERSIYVGNRGVGTCPGLATFSGRTRIETAPIAPDSLLNVRVPNLLPGTYQVGVMVQPIPSKERMPLTVELGITGVKLECDLTRIALLPNNPYRTLCRAVLVPADGVAPPGAVYVFTSSDPGTAIAELTDDNIREAVVTSKAPGTTNLSVTLQALDSVRLTSNAVAIEVVDAYPPSVVETSTTATSPLSAGASIPVHVHATDNYLVSRILLRASGDAVVESQQEVPCPLLENECEADFTVHLKESDFSATSTTITAEAIDGSGNHGSTPRPLVLAIGGDIASPVVTIHSPADRATVNPGSTGHVMAQATDNQGVAKFIYSATGPALKAPIVNLELPVLPVPLPLATLGFNFEVKPESELAAVTDRNIVIRVEAVDAAGNKSDAKTITLTVAGSGDVQVTLVWSDTNDLDLRVVEPSGTVIYFGNRTSETGGQLDVDANASCSGATSSPVENIFWPAGRAPTGTYRVVVSYYAACPEPAVASTFTVRIRVDGVDRPPITQTISGSAIEVDSFTR